MLVAGVDSSTQSTKVVLCQAEDGAIVATGSAPHPDGTGCDPAYWWEALCRAGEGLLDRSSAIGVAAQQHGMVALDDAGEVIRPAILWNDMRAASQTRELIAELGPADWARRTGSVTCGTRRSTSRSSPTAGWDTNGWTSSRWSTFTASAEQLPLNIGPGRSNFRSGPVG